MEKVIFKISSITDVITNSSTEVFQRYDESSFDVLKELINNVLKLSNSNLTFDDLFEIRLDIELDDIIDEYGEYLERLNNGEKAVRFRDADYQEKYEMLENEDYDTILQIAREYDEARYSDGYPAINGYTVSLKSDIAIENKELAKKIAEQLSNMDNLFECYACYC